MQWKWLQNKQCYGEIKFTSFPYIKSKLNEIKLLSFLPHHFTCEYQLMTGCDCQADIVQGDHWDQRGRYMELDNLAFLA